MKFLKFEKKQVIRGNPFYVRQVLSILLTLSIMFMLGNRIAVTIQDEQMEESQHINELMQKSVQQLERDIERRVDGMNLLASVCESGIMPWDEQLQPMREQLENRFSIGNILYINRDYQMIDAEGNPAGTVQKDRLSWMESCGKVFSGEKENEVFCSYHPDSGETEVGILVPVYAGHEITGLLAAAVPHAELETEFGADYQIPRFWVILYDSDGRPILSSSGKESTSMGSTLQDSLLRYSNLEETEISSLEDSLRNGEGSIRFTYQAENRQMELALQKLSVADWYVAIYLEKGFGLDVENHADDILSTRMYFYILEIIALAVLLLSIYTIYRQANKDYRTA